MKRAMLPVMILALATPGLAQESTLIGRGIESGGFGAAVFKVGEFADEFAVFAGGRGGWIINHTFVLGAGGYGLSNDIDFGFIGARDVEFGYGGLELEYIHLSDNLVHFTVYMLLGGGGLSGPAVEDEAVFVLEPAVNAELNVTHYFRLQGGVGYRFVSGVDSVGLDGSDLSASYGQLTFKFGSF